MKNLIIAILVLGIGCKKSSDPLDNFVNNDIQIKVLWSSGDSSFYSYHGSNAVMYITWGLGSANVFQAEGKISSNERQIIFGVDQYDSTKVSCSYFPTGDDNPYHTDDFDPGPINFSSFANNHAAGTFTANCKSFSDSVVITGTFSGYYNN